MRSIHIVTYGCQMNKLDSELVAHIPTAAGHELVDSPAEADTVLFMTCSVRDQAENRVLSAIGSLRRRAEHEAGFIVGVLGCMAQRLGEELLRRAPGVRLVCGTRQFQRIAELLADAERGPVVAIEEDAGGADLPERHFAGGIQAFVAVMRGCNNYCSYCIVPSVRGREESVPPDRVMDEVRRVTERGAVEVTLLGQSIDKYGLDLEPRESLFRLYERVHETPGLVRLRFLTAHPKNITQELFETMARLPKVCEHLHMPAQSGSDAILSAMNRRYTRAQYDGLLALGRRIVPGLAFTSDFIVGYPGETDADFEATLELVSTAEFSNIYAFRYSPRPGAKSAGLADDVPQAVKEERLARLLAAQEIVSRRRNAALVGSVQEVLAEGVSRRDARNWTGRTRSNGIVAFGVPEGLNVSPGQLLRVTVTDATPLTLLGQVAAPG